MSVGVSNQAAQGAPSKFLKMIDFESLSKSTKALFVHQEAMHLGKSLSDSEEHAIATRLFIDLIINVLKRVGEPSLFDYILETAKKEFFADKSGAPQVKTL